MNKSIEELQQPEQTAQEQTQENKSIVPSVVRNSTTSGVRTVARDSNTGRFASRRKKLDEELKITERVERDIRTLLTRPATDDQGQPIKDANGKPVPLHIKVAEHLLSVAMKLDDPKALGGAAKMLESIMTRGLGKPSDSAVTRDALQHSGIRVVFVPPIPGIPRDNEPEKEPLKCPWASSEVVSIDAAKNSDQITPEERTKE